MSVLSRRFPARALAVALLAAGAAWSCSDGGSPAQRENLKVYRHSFDEVPKVLDPVQASSQYINYIVLNAYDTLFAYKYLARPYELKPNLAAAMPEFSADGLSLTIRLKQGVRFMDDPCFEGGVGREVSAADFVYSLKRHFDPASLSQGTWLWRDRIVGLDDWGSTGADYSADIEGLRALDSHTVQIRLTRPFPQIVHTLAQGFSAIVPREAVERYGRELSVHPVGSGPFIVDSFDTTMAVLRRNPNYRSEPVDLAFEGYDEALHGPYGIEQIDGLTPPFVDRVEISFIPEASARVTSLTKGNEIHYARLQGSDYETFLASTDPIRLNDRFAEQFHMAAGLESGFVFHTFNLLDDAFGDGATPEDARRNKALRCAMIKGFDWQERNDRFYGGVARVFPGVIPPVVPEYDPDAPQDSIEYDPDGARRLLAEHGWTAGNLPKMVYGVPSSVRQTQMFEQFRGFMQKIGFPGDKIVLKQYPAFGDIARDWKRARLPLVNKAWSLDYPDAENTLQLYYGPNASPGSNDANYRNAEFDRLYEASSVMQPGPERTALYRQMNQMLIDDCVAFTGLSRTMILLWNKDVVGYPDRAITGGFWMKYVDVPAPSGR